MNNRSVDVQNIDIGLIGVAEHVNPEYNPVATRGLVTITANLAMPVFIVRWGPVTIQESSKSEINILVRFFQRDEMLPRCVIKGKGP
jgi:hypothetical protein